MWFITAQSQGEQLTTLNVLFHMDEDIVLTGDKELIDWTGCRDFGWEKVREWLSGLYSTGLGCINSDRVAILLSLTRVLKPPGFPSPCS
jgi:hypothetical protein